MSRIAIYPGTFDPVTLGHVDVIKKSLKIVDRLIVATTANIEKKEHLFDVDERMEILKKSLFYDLHLDRNKIKIISFDGLTTKLCKKYKASLIIRGLRAVSDFEYEFQLSGMNKRLNPNIETLFMTPSEEFANISSSLVREIFLLGGDIGSFVPESVKLLLLEKYTK